jgi:hypothetical protein
MPLHALLLNNTITAYHRRYSTAELASLKSIGTVG